MNLKIIKSDNEYEGALAELTKLMALELAPDCEQFRTLEVLSVLLEKYESEIVDLPAVDPIEAIKFRMDQSEMVNKDLKPYLGSMGKVSEVMNRKRPLSLSMIRNLHKGLGIPYS